MGGKHGTQNRHVEVRLLEQDEDIMFLGGERGFL